MTSATGAFAARYIPAFGLAIGVCGLALQGWLTIPAAQANGMTLGGAIVFFFSFFTIQSNILIVAAYVAALSRGTSPVARFFRRPAVLTGLGVYMLLVVAVYAAILRHLWHPTGLLKVADTLLHYVAPAMFLAYWGFGVAKGATSLRTIRTWLLFPLLYVAYALARGSATGHYPYPFLEVPMLGATAVLRNVAMLVGVFVALSLAMVGLDRWLGHRAAGRSETVTR